MTTPVPQTTLPAVTFCTRGPWAAPSAEGTAISRGRAPPGPRPITAVLSPTPRRPSFYALRNEESRSHAHAEHDERRRPTASAI